MRYSHFCNDETMKWKVNDGMSKSVSCTVDCPIYLVRLLISRIPCYKNIISNHNPRIAFSQTLLTNIPSNQLTRNYQPILGGGLTFRSHLTRQKRFQGTVGNHKGIYPTAWWCTCCFMTNYYEQNKNGICGTCESLRLLHVKFHISLVTTLKLGILNSN